MPWVMPEAFGRGDDRVDAYFETMLEDEMEGYSDGTDGAGAHFPPRADAPRPVREDREGVEGPGERRTERKEKAKWRGR